MNKNALRLAAASLLAIAAQNAMAASVISTSSAMQNLSYRLVDLDPDDGIDPSITFYTTNWGSPEIGVADTMAKTEVRYGNRYEDGYLDRGSTSAEGNAFSRPDLVQASPDGVARAVSGPQGMSASLDISTDALTDPRNFSGSRFSFSASSDVSRSLSEDQRFSLSPKTKLIVEGVADSLIQLDVSSLKGTALDAILNHPLGQLAVRRWGLATYSMSFYNDDAAGTPDEWVRLWVGASSLSTHLIDKSGIREVDIAPDYPSLDHEVFQAELVNDSDRTVSGYYGWMNNTMIEVTGAVPEPGTWALMGLGLVGLGWLGRRRDSSIR